MSEKRAGTTIVVPVRHEEGSVGPLLKRLHAATNGLGHSEVLFVDDSDNHHTGDAIRNAAAHLHGPHFHVRHIHRNGDERWGGLSGAVIDGFREASAPIVLVMDGDGQHPPETVPQVIDKVHRGHDIVVASRYRDGGSSDGLDGLKRRLVSRGATVLTRLLFPRGMRGISDPMTGFFALRRDQIDMERIGQASGYKILMEILVSHPELQRDEVPLDFQARIDGESKADEGNGFEFIKQLVRLRMQTLPTWLNFAFGGGMIALLGALMLAGMVALGVNPLAANAIQMGVTLGLNFAYNRNVTWRGERRRSLRYHIVSYALTRVTTQTLGWAAFVGLMGLATQHHIFGEGWRSQIANVIATGMVTVLNYLTSKYFVFGSNKSGTHRRKAASVRRSQVIALTGALSVFIGVQCFAIAAVGFATWFLGLILVYAAFSLLSSAKELQWRLYGSNTPESEAARKFEPPVMPEDAQYTFSIIVPALHEADVIGGTLQRALDQTHPNVQIVVSLVQGDDETIAVVQELATRYPAERLTIVVDSYVNGSKPKQLNRALEFCTGEFVGILDAESIAHPDLVASAEATLCARDADMIQCGVLLTNLDLPIPPGTGRLGRLWITIRGWFCVHNVMEYWSWFSSRLFWQLTKGVMPYGGNSLFHRTELLVRKGGWPVTLTEDCSLGIRDSAEGKVVMTAAFDPALATREQTPGRIFGSGGLVKQRARWDQGFWEELLHGEWLKLPTVTQRLNALYILGMPLIQAINGLFVPLALVGMFTLHTRASVAVSVFLPLIPMVLTVLTQMLGLREFSRKMGVKAKFRHYASLALLSPAYQVLLAWPAIKSMVRWAKGNNTWDRTVKQAALADFTVMTAPEADEEQVLQPA